MTVKSYRNEEQLSKPKDGATITLIPDIPNIVEDDLPLDSITLHGVQVSGIQNLLCYPACFSCNAKVNATNEKKIVESQNVESYNQFKIACNNWPPSSTSKAELNFSPLVPLAKWWQILQGVHCMMKLQQKSCFLPSRLQ